MKLAIKLLKTEPSLTLAFCFVQSYESFLMYMVFQEITILSLNCNIETISHKIFASTNNNIKLFKIKYSYILTYIYKIVQYTQIF